MSKKDKRVVCNCDNPEGEVYVDAPSYDNETYILMRRDGTVTNRWADGVVGVPEEIREDAEQDEEPFCPDCESYCEWDT